VKLSSFTEVDVTEPEIQPLAGSANQAPAPTVYPSSTCAILYELKGEVLSAAGRRVRR